MQYNIIGALMPLNKSFFCNITVSIIFTVIKNYQQSIVNIYDSKDN
jgi:hypothetical protein